MNTGYDSFADQYDFLTRDISSEEWADYLCTFLDANTIHRGRLADVGCGTGSIALILAERDYTVFGVDRSEGMLNVAAAKAREKGLRIMFSRQDVENLSLNSMNAITMNNDVLNYVAKDELEKVFTNVYKALNKGGMFLFDVSSSYKLRNVIGNNFFYEDHDDVTYFWKNTLLEDRVEMELTFFVKKNGVYERRDEFQTQYIHEEKDIKDALEKAGFETETFEFMTELPPEKNTERLFFVCRKGK